MSEHDLDCGEKWWIWVQSSRISFYFSIFFPFFVTIFFLASILFATNSHCDGVSLHKFPFKDAGMWLGYSGSESDPSSSAVSSHVSHEFTWGVKIYASEIWKVYSKWSRLDRPKHWSLPERELFLCRDASHSHLLSTSKTLPLPRLLCRTTAQTCVTAYLQNKHGCQSGRTTRHPTIQS